MQKVTYTNSRGESIVFSHRPPFVLSNIEGLGDVDADIQSQKSPYQDGVTHIDTNLEPRYINMEISVVGKDVDKYRRHLSKVMNPKLEGVLRYEDGSIIREIVCINEHVPNYPSKGQSFQLATVNLECPNPYWQDEDETSQELAVFIGEFSFPLTLPTRMGIQGEKVVIDNTGDIEAPVEIEFHGPAENPVVMNNRTGEFIKVKRNIEKDETLILSTTFGDKKVEIVDEEGNATDAFHWIDLDSTFWQLQVGENEIEYSADVGADSAVVFVKYRRQYVGV